MVNGVPDSMLCMTSSLVLHRTTCGYNCTRQQVVQSNAIKEQYLARLSSPYMDRLRTIMLLKNIRL